MSTRVQVQQLLRKRYPPPSAFERGYLDAGDGKHNAILRLDYCKALYPKDWLAQREYLDGWLMYTAEEGLIYG
jgi:hypothetical protein